MNIVFWRDCIDRWWEESKKLQITNYKLQIGEEDRFNE
jgi:hypothetical protein